jgi:large subunit ribosomal protein L14
MIPVGAVIKPADNSGAKKLKVIGIPGSSRKRFASVGEIVTVVISGATSVGAVQDHSVMRALIVRTKKESRRKDGSYVRFSDNAAVVMSKENEMAGTRIFGPIAREIRDKGYLKIASLAKEVW